MSKLSSSESLVDIVYDLMQEGDVVCCDRFKERFVAKTNNQHEDIVELNRFWRTELGKAPVGTISERECLIDAIEPVDWLRHFKSQVLPTILRFKLPKV